MRKYIGALLALLACASCLCSCNNDDTYADQKKRERKVINAFLNRDVAIIDEEGDTICRVGKINPITEAQFYAQDSTTNVEKNEYVLFSGSGIYMQIVREGVGEKLKSGDNKRILCRFIEYNIMGQQPRDNACVEHLRQPERQFQYVYQRWRCHVLDLQGGERAHRMGEAALVHTSGPPDERRRGDCQGAYHRSTLRGNQERDKLCVSLFLRDTLPGDA